MSLNLILDQFIRHWFCQIAAIMLNIGGGPRAKSRMVEAGKGIVYQSSHHHNHSPDAILSFMSSVTQDSVRSINICLLLVLSMSESTVLSCFLFQNTEDTLLPSLLHSDCLPHISLVTCKARSSGAVLSKQNRNEMVAGWGKKRAGEKGSCGGKSGDREDHQGLGVGCHVLS